MGTSKVDMPWWAWGVLIFVLLTLLGGTVTAAGWVTTTLISHDGTIAEHGVRHEGHDKALDRIEVKLDKILEELRRR